jgi:hypothetical protein
MRDYGGAISALDVLAWRLMLGQQLGHDRERGRDRPKIVRKWRREGPPSPSFTGRSACAPAWRPTPMLGPDDALKIVMRGVEKEDQAIA